MVKPNQKIIVSRLDPTKHMYEKDRDIEIRLSNKGMHHWTCIHITERDAIRLIIKLIKILNKELGHKWHKLVYNFNKYREINDIYNNTIKDKQIKEDELDDLPF